MQPLEAMSKNQKKDKARKKEDLPTGNTLEPSYVYKTLLQVMYRVSWLKNLLFTSKYQLKVHLLLF